MRSMLRLNEIKLPLNHSTTELRLAIVERLGIEAAQLVDYSIYKRSYDARKKTDILLIYQIDAVLAKDLEARLLAANPKSS